MRLNSISIQKGCFLLFIIYYFSQLTYSQNLVPNSSFEDANCPTGYTGFPNQVEMYLQNWYSANCASPDPITTCSNHAFTTVPNSIFASQYARTGDNYVGLGFYNAWYEYIGIQLSSPLEAGEDYNVSFWVVCAEKKRYASDALGLYLSTTKDYCPSGFGGPVLNYTPQISQAPGVFLTDTANWTEISGTYSATGGEEYIVIGCFKPWNTLTFHDFNNGQQTQCYYLIDDVSVEKIIPLSTHLTLFQAYTNKKEVSIQWETISDETMCHYIVERSSNGYLFEPVQEIIPHKNNSVSNYYYTDRSPLKGVSYYRLKSVDCNGKTVHSKIVPIEIPYPKIEVFPNPAKDAITISSFNTESFPIIVSIYNTLGEKLFSEELSAEQQVFDISGIKTGIYTLSINLEGETILQKITKY